ncbi:MAG: hypothetical protein MZV63_21915 [Marinilabiliales bacterium]|nr:hypothetical protein [Marinilabiliales bacterium]
MTSSHTVHHYYLAAGKDKVYSSAGASVLVYDMTQADHHHPSQGCQD